MSCVALVPPPHHRRIRTCLKVGALVFLAALPAIKGPVQIIGGAWSRTGTHSVIDGSGYVTKDCTLYSRDVFAQFSLRLRVAGIGGTILAAPVWLYQFGAFINAHLDVVLDPLEVERFRHGSRRTRSRRFHREARRSGEQA